MCIFILHGIGIVLEQNGQPYFIGPSFMGSFPGFPVSDSELKLSSDLDMAVLALSLDFLCGCFWTFVFDDSFSLLEVGFLVAKSFGFASGVLEHEDLASFRKDRTFVTRNGVSFELSS